MDQQNLPSQNTSQEPSLNQSRCMHSGSYSKISILAQLHNIIKFQKNAKLLINVRCNHLRKVCLSTFFIATGTSKTLKNQNQKRLITKKLCPIEVGWFLLIDEISTSCSSGTRSHRRLIFRIMKSHRMYSL